MNLELISRTDSTAGGRPSLLFIHGGFHGAWCWAEHYLPFFQRHGWAAHALSLRGHGESEGADRIRDWSLGDYCDDVRDVLDKLGAPAVLIGHSMGGVIAQMCWPEREKVAGMALVASSPLRPSLSVVTKMVRKKPYALVMGQLRQDPVLLREAMSSFFLSPDLPFDRLNRYHEKLSLESPKAMGELFSRNPPQADPNDSRPVHVIAGREDWSIPLTAHEPIVQAYDATFDICPGYHDLMLDPEWEVSAGSILSWLDSNWHGASTKS